MHLHPLWLFAPIALNTAQASPTLQPRQFDLPGGVDTLRLPPDTERSNAASVAGVLVVTGIHHADGTWDHFTFSSPILVDSQQKDAHAIDFTPRIRQTLQEVSATAGQSVISTRTPLRSSSISLERISAELILKTIEALSRCVHAQRSLGLGPGQVAQRILSQEHSGSNDGRVQRESVESSS